MGATGQLIWSVNLSAPRGRVADARSLREGAAAVLDVLGRHQMPATWTAPEPAAMAGLCRDILARPGHDIGLLGDASWVSDSRTTFHRELSRRSEAARAAGIGVQCLATGGASLENHLDILVRHRIATIRVDGAQWRMASSRRYGIWQLSVTDVVPGRPGPWGGRLGYRRLLAQCARQSQTILLVVEAGQMNDSKRVRLLDHICRYAARRTNLAVCPFAAVARRMLAPTPAAGAGSILRAA